MTARVLVREEISEAGVDLFAHASTWTSTPTSSLEEIIGGYDAIVVRSATKLTADLIERADRLKVIGSAGVGVDNVDVEAATRRGIIVANAPESTVVSAAEHTIGLLVALARNIPQAHAALKQGRWERSAYGGIELAGKTLGVLGFGRIGQQVARSALGLGMRVVAHDPYVAAERFRELGAERRRDAGGRVRGRRLPHPAPAPDRRDARLDRRGRVRSHASRCADRQRRPRPAPRRGGAARGAPLGQDRRGRARRVRRASRTPGRCSSSTTSSSHRTSLLRRGRRRTGRASSWRSRSSRHSTGGLVTNAVNIPVVGAEDLEVLGPYVPLASRLGRIAMELADGAAEEIVITVYGGARRLRRAPPHRRGAQRRLPGPRRRTGQLRQCARSIAAERGIEVREERSRTARDYTDLVRVELRRRRSQLRASPERRSAAITARGSSTSSASRSSSSSLRSSCSAATTTCPA